MPVDRLKEWMKWLTSWSPYQYLDWLSNTYVLIGAGVLFLLALKLRRKIIASVILGVVGLYHVFRLVPQKTGNPIQDLKTLLMLLGSTQSLLFIGGLLVVMCGIGYILTREK